MKEEIIKEPFFSSALQYGRKARLCMYYVERREPVISDLEREKREKRARGVSDDDDDDDDAYHMA